MTTVNEIFADIRAIVRRGTALDDAFPAAFRSALDFIEANYNLAGMKAVQTRQVLAGVSTLAFTDIAPAKTKSITKVGYQVGSAWQYLDQVDPGDFVSSEGDYPAGYIATKATSGWLLTFDASWLETTTLTFWTYNYTVWDGDVNNSSIWALDDIRTALVQKAMVYLAPVMRDVSLAKVYNELFLESIAVKLQADGEFQQGAR